MVNKKDRMNTIQRDDADEAYAKGRPIMSDADYDATFGDESTHHLATALTKPGKKVSLPVWMGSLDKKRDAKSLEAWLKKTSTDDFIVSAKLDGISALYDPKKNKLYTRGNGQTGCDISRFINHIKNADRVFENLASNQSGSLQKYIRGELIMANDVFDLKYHDFKNPRNLVAGQFNKKIINENIIADISFIPYELIVPCLPTQYPVFEQLRDNPLQWVNMDKAEINVESLTTLLNEWTKDSNFEIDGLVVMENRMYTRNLSGNPKYAIAFKKDVSTEVKANVIDVTWDISRWGLFKPVVIIEPVQLSGIIIHKLNGHNAKYILDNNIGPGAQILCHRSGNVIPCITSIVKPSNNIILPSKTWKGVDLCVNPGTDLNTDAIEIKKLVNIFSKLNVEHVNLKTIEKMYRECNLNSFPKIMRCTETDLESSFKYASVQRIVVGISALKTRWVKASLIVGASGILGSGLGLKRVESLFACLDTLKSGNWRTIPTVEEVMRVEGFAKVTANRVVDSFPDMISFLDMCLENGLKLQRYDDDLIL